MSCVLTANDNKTSPRTSQELTCRQMCFDWTNETLSGNCDTLLLTGGRVKVQVWICWGAIRENALSGLINTATQMRGSIIFIDETRVGRYRKALNRHLRGDLLHYCLNAVDTGLNGFQMLVMQLWQSSRGWWTRWNSEDIQETCKQRETSYGYKKKTRLPVITNLWLFAKFAGR